MTDEQNERAARVWQEACGSYEDNSHDLTLSIRERTIAGDQADAAVLAREFEADRVRIGALEKIAAFAVHHVTCKLYQASYAVTFPSCSCGLDRLRAALKDHPHD